MKLFKRKEQAQPETQIQEENVITATDFDKIPLDEKTQKQIADSDIANDPETDEIPSANSNERDTGNNRKFKFAIAAVIGTLISLIGIGGTVGRYQEKRAESKAIEAQQAAQAQKQMATGNGVDIAKDQKEIEKSNFQELPPPAGAQTSLPTDVTSATVSNAPMATHSNYIEPVEPITPPPTPRPKYSSSDSLVAGRDYVTPAPVPNTPSTASFNPIEMGGSKSRSETTPVSNLESATTQIAVPKGADSNVLVDVNAVKVTATNTAVGQRQGKLANSLTPTILADGEAGKRANTNMLLVKGTSIPCVLKTKIDSTYQGFTACQISKDVYSANGKTLLIERGSTVFGEQNTQIQQGQARVSVLWTKIETPKGISINIDSPATGQLGEMGIGAKVNNHFLKRFGSSIMLSIIQDGLAAASKRWEGNSDTSGSNNTTVSNSTNTVESMAEKALNNTINMPPTAIVNQGAILNILVARDVDFSSVYRVVKR
ncbi:hypothetical protein HG534_10955 [Moraxella osloensis]|nr:type IV secretion system protein VirB10 [Moraxella osloensis]MBW4016810.1 hypothetical protein [Moraxella osloensis]MBW4019206.1 hypothetical protein [Moraxella osloensis]VWX31839.1 conserved hypothetical protein [Moraxellaceae bacterium 17A]